MQLIDPAVGTLPYASDDIYELMDRLDFHNRVQRRSPLRVKDLYREHGTLRLKVRVQHEHVV